MIIRHAEKPSDDAAVRGVTLHGVRDKHDLSVRGWQRAGALVRFFAPREPRPAGAPISQPRSIFASAAIRRSPSVRAQHTVRPLAAVLDLHVNKHHADGEEEALAVDVLAAEGPVLIAWHHGQIPALVQAIAGKDIPCPRKWPDERFDLVWVLDRNGGGNWSFSQAPQCLLAHDCVDPA